MPSRPSSHHQESGLEQRRSGGGQRQMEDRAVD
jgi:hypothetical protein